MAVIQWWDRVNLLPDISKSAPLLVREKARRKQLVSTILLVVAGFNWSVCQVRLSILDHLLSELLCWAW
jgi:hypothetical protein